MLLPVNRNARINNGRGLRLDHDHHDRLRRGAALAEPQYAAKHRLTDRLSSDTVTDQSLRGKTVANGLFESIKVSDRAHSEMDGLLFNIDQLLLKQSMKHSRFPSLLLIGFCLSFVYVPPTLALKVRHMTWEEHVENAAFIGVVECEEDAFSLIKGPVLESWKGAKRGARISIKVQLWEKVGEVFPVKKGERYLVAAQSVPKNSAANDTPVVWDYVTPLYQGMNKLSRSKRGPFPGLGSPHPDLDTFKKAALDFLALDREEQELRTLKTLADRFINERFYNYSTSKVDIDEKVQAIQGRYREAKTVELFIKELIPLKDCKPSGRSYAGPEALSDTVRQGGEFTLKVLKSLPPQAYPGLGGDIQLFEFRASLIKKQETSNPKTK